MYIAFIVRTYFKRYSQYINSIEISQGGSNTDSGSKRGVQCRYTANFYLALTVRNLSKL